MHRVCDLTFGAPFEQVTVGIQGRAVGCSVRLEKKEDPFARGCGVPDSVNFREVKVGVTTTRVINLYNEASTPCRFCFLVQVRGACALGVDNPRGKVAIFQCSHRSHCSSAIGGASHDLSAL